MNVSRMFWDYLSGNYEEETRKYMGIFPHLRFFRIPELEGSITQASFQILETESLPFDSESDDQQYVISRFVAARKF